MLGSFQRNLELRFLRKALKFQNTEVNSGSNFTDWSILIFAFDSTYWRVFPLADSNLLPDYFEYSYFGGTFLFVDLLPVS